MKVCEGTVPDVEIPYSRIVERADEDGQVVHEVERGVNVTPAHPCDEPAIMLARSMKQQECDLGEVHWVKTGDKVYCAAHYLAGTMTHLDGKETSHAAMAVEEEV